MSIKEQINQEIIRCKDDIFEMLDLLMEQRESEWWNGFYEDRERTVPFYQNIPDENLVEYVENKKVFPGKTLEIGCGPGRNAIYLNQQGYRVNAIDFSEVSIQWAKERAEENSMSIDFQCVSFFDYPASDAEYDFIYDSGVLHHIKPHRREDYLQRIWKLMKPEGFFGLVCFNLKGGANITDYDVYRDFSMKGGLGFSEYKLKEVLTPFFEIIEFREMNQNISDDLMGEEYLWTVLMKKKKEITTK